MQNSLWLAGIEKLSLNKLSSSLNCDVCIVGGGLTGIYTAYLLAKRGVSVVLLEGNSSVGIATTGHSTGKLTPQHDAVFSKLLKSFSEDEVRTYYDVNVNAIESALKNVPIDLYQRVDSYLYATTEQGKATLDDEIQAYKTLQIEGYENAETELPFDILSSIKLPNTAQIHPTNFALHFAKLAMKEGANLFVNSRVTKVDEKTVYVDDDLHVSFNHLVLATHYPIEAFKGLQLAKLSIDRSYLTATKTTELLKGQYLSVDTPSRTIRTALINNQPYFIYGGSSHKAGMIEDTHNYYETLENEVVSKFDLEKPEYLWSAQDPNTADSLPYVGPITENESNLYIATGYRKWGLSNSLVAGEIITSAILKEEHPGAHIYNPARNQFGKTMLRMLGMIGFTVGNLADGYLTRLDAPKCTHLGCKTRWNDGDETWDCPCHGSRFDKFGNVIEGPAVYPLDLK
ncbi:MAG TPA: FAD-dependent oxidoreductase [Ureibacillus sp.]|nr:FAD-dependent oxidoreductase [Ureibacillus sp.]